MTPALCIAIVWVGLGAAVLAALLAGVHVVEEFRRPTVEENRERHLEALAALRAEQVVELDVYKARRRAGAGL